jgi:hypothetical protein
MVAKSGSIALREMMFNAGEAEKGRKRRRRH